MATDHTHTVTCDETSTPCPPNPHNPPSKTKMLVDDTPPSTTLVDGTVVQGTPPAEKVPEALHEHARVLPAANIMRVMKDAIPDDTRVAKKAGHLMQLILTEAICFVASEANDLATTTVDATHIVDAARRLDLGQEADLAAIALPALEPTKAGPKAA